MGRTADRREHRQARHRHRADRRRAARRGRGLRPRPAVRARCALHGAYAEEHARHRRPRAQGGAARRSSRSSCPSRRRSAPSSSAGRSRRPSPARCSRINPFDEPNVQQAKDATQRAARRATRRTAGCRLGRADRTLDGGVTLTLSARRATALGDARRRGAPDAARAERLLRAARVPRPRRRARRRAATRCRMAVRDRTRAATMFGYGPRYLHSTGQLHKGGPNTGVFVLITATPREDSRFPASRSRSARWSWRRRSAISRRSTRPAAARCTCTCRRPIPALRDCADAARTVAARRGCRTTGSVERPASAGRSEERTAMQTGIRRTRQDGPEHGDAPRPRRPPGRRATTAAPTRSRSAAAAGASGVASLDALVAALAPPRAVWVMVPAGDAHRVDGRRARRPAVGRRHDHRRRQHQLPRRRAPRARRWRRRASTTSTPARAAASGASGRLLPDGRRRGRRLQAPRADLPDARAARTATCASAITAPATT